MKLIPSDVNRQLLLHAERLTALYQQSFQGRFPYEDLRKLVRKAGTNFAGLGADLDLYFSTIVGYCSWGKQILNWSHEKRQEALRYVSCSFVDRHPEYKSVLSLIEESKLSKQLDNIEEMRTTLWHVLTLLDNPEGISS